ncbi:MAG: flagellar filament capping protein FliD [Thiomicrorhabdus sp.]|jgi:flagellar hook-associated protein 2|nr:flagellar filament capping protein FliD [Thiomicrorhabdus sp.]
MAITFGGLATGIDTESIITELMTIERFPIDRLEKDQAYYKNRLNAFSEMDGKLKSFLEKAEAIDTRLELNSPKVNGSSEDYLSASVDSNAQLGSYQLTVIDLAQQQKDVSQGYVDKFVADFGTGSINLTVAGTANSITIDSSNNSLDGIAQAINDAELGVSAAVINDGTGEPYRLVLTGNSVSESFSLDTSGLGGGSAVNPTMSNTQIAQQAHILLDGIDVYSDSNSVNSAVPGLSIELLKADAEAITTLNVSTDNEATTEKINEFVVSYNEIITFIGEQKETGWANDSAFRSIKSHLQSLLVTQVGEGSYTSLSRVGFETQRDGTITLNSSTLSSALSDDYDAVLGLFSGSEGVEGISTRFASYLDTMTNSIDGLYAGRKETTESNTRRIDQRINSLEARLELKEESMRAQFSAMEELVSGLNAQGDYLLQQLAALPTIGS